MNKSSSFISNPYGQEAAVSGLKVPANLICILWVQFTGFFKFLRFFKILSCKTVGFYSEATPCFWKEDCHYSDTIPTWSL